MPSIWFLSRRLFTKSIYPILAILDKHRRWKVTKRGTYSASKLHDSKTYKKSECTSVQYTRLYNYGEASSKHRRCFSPACAARVSDTLVLASNNVLTFWGKKMLKWLRRAKMFTSLSASIDFEIADGQFHKSTLLSEGSNHMQCFTIWPLSSPTLAASDDRLS